MKTLSKIAGILFFAGALALPSQAAENAGLMQSKVKAALNEMVQDVRAAQTPAEKREVMDRFLGSAEQRTAVASAIPFLSTGKKAGLSLLQGKFATYDAELNGKAGHAAVADPDLDAYAGFMQQDLEQAAEAAWGNGGVYLSAGAIIVILLILILIT